MKKMKSIKKLYGILFIFVILISLVACVDKNKDDNKFKPTPISTVLTTYKNNQDLQIEGVVYGVIKNGFYISDSNECGIFVVMGDNWKKNVAIGDKVQLTGQFSISNNYRQVKNVTSSVVVSSNNPITLTASELTIDEINTLNYTNKTGSYAKLITVTGTIEKNLSGVLMIKDDEGKTVLVYDQSNELVNSNLSKRVKITVVSHRYDSVAACWIVSFAGTSTDIVNAELTFETLVEMVKQHLDSVVPTEFFGNLELPTEHSIFKELTYSWEVEENEYVKIENSKVKIKLDDADHKLKFYVNVNYGTETTKLTYELTSKAIVHQSISSLLANKPLVNMSTVCTSGIVVAISRNQSTSLRSFVLQDKTTLETVVVDFTNKESAVIPNTSDEFKNVKMGDEIKITGLFDNGDRCSIEQVSSLEVLSTGNNVTHDFDNAFELSNEESYNELGQNYKSYVGKLIKVTNPFLNYSTSSTPADTNWVRFGWNKSSGNTGFGVSGDTHVFAFLIAAQNESLGSDSWHKNYEIPFINNPDGAKQFTVTYYVYPVYFEDSTYFQFIIPSVECIEVVGSEKINLDLAESIPTYVDKAKTDSIELPTTHKNAGAVTWTSSNENAISSTGVVGNVTKATNVVLTAKYYLDSTEQTVEFKVAVVPSESQTVSEVLENTEDIFVKFTGIVVSFVSDGNTQESRNGVLVLDPENGKTVLLTNLTAISSKTIGKYTDQSGKLIKVGDEITALGKYSLSSGAIASGPEQAGRNSVELSSDSILTVDVENVEFNYHLENAIEIKNHTELTEFTKNLKYGTVLKIVGTKDNPIYIGGSSSSMPFNIKVFYTADGKPITNNNNTKYEGQTYSLKSDVIGYTLGDNWYQDVFGITKAFIAPNSTNSGIAVYGEIYVAVAYRTGTYYQMCAVNVDAWNVKCEGDLDDVKKLFSEIIPTEIEGGKQDFVLPAKTLFTEGTITWVSSDSTVFDISTMTAYAADKNKEVNLNATFILNGEEQTVSVKMIVKGTSQTLEVEQISTLLSTGLNNTFKKTEGIVVNYHSDGNTTGVLRGIILMDPETKELLLVDGIESLTPTDEKFSHGNYYATDGTKLSFGDMIELTGNFVIDGTRKSLVVTADDSEVIIKSKNNTITWGDPTVTISNNTEMTTFASNLQVGVLVKFVGTADNPFCFGGSSSTASSINYKFFYNADATKNDEVKYTVIHGSTSAALQFSFKGQVNVPTLGDNWWDTYFGLPAGFVGPTDKIPPYKYSGTIYAVISAVTSTYVQMSFVKVENISEIK